MLQWERTSRKFRVLLYDVVISLVLYFVGRFLPAAAEDIKFLIITIQPVMIAVIAGTAYEDGQANSAAITVNETPRAPENYDELLKRAG